MISSASIKSLSYKLGGCEEDISGEGGGRGDPCEDGSVFISRDILKLILLIFYKKNNIATEKETSGSL